MLYYEDNKTTHPRCGLHIVPQCRVAEVSICDSGTFKLEGPSVRLTTERPFCLEFTDHTRQKKAPVVMVTSRFLAAEVEA